MSLLKAVMVFACEALQTVPYFQELEMSIIYFRVVLYIATIIFG